MNGYDIFKAMGETEEKYVEMSESRPAPKRSPRVIKIAFAAAAAVILTAGIGSYTSPQFYNPESVGLYLGNPDKVAAGGNVVNQVMENGHIRITVDTVLSDGYNALVLVTLDALDDYGRNFLRYCPDIRLKRTDTGEPVFHTGGGSMYDWKEQVRNDTVSYYHTVDLSDMDISCDYEIIFFSDGLFSQEDWENAGSVETDGNRIPIDNPLGYDFIARVSLGKNVETVRLKSADGDELILSQFELAYARDDVVVAGMDGMLLIQNDGTREEIDRTKTFGTGSALFFGKFIDLDEYRGVEIDGVEYLKT